MYVAYPNIKIFFLLNVALHFIHKLRKNELLLFTFRKHTHTRAHISYFYCYKPCEMYFSCLKYLTFLTVFVERILIYLLNLQTLHKFILHSSQTLRKYFVKQCKQSTLNARQEFLYIRNNEHTHTKYVCLSTLSHRYADKCLFYF